MNIVGPITIRSHANLDVVLKTNDIDANKSAVFYGYSVYPISFRNRLTQEEARHDWLYRANIIEDRITLSINNPDSLVCTIPYTVVDNRTLKHRSHHVILFRVDMIELSSNEGDMFITPDYLFRKIVEGRKPLTLEGKDNMMSTHAWIHTYYDMCNLTHYMESFMTGGQGEEQNEEQKEELQQDEELHDEEQKEEGEESPPTTPITELGDPGDIPMEIGTPVAPPSSPVSDVPLPFVQCKYTVGNSMVNVTNIEHYLLYSHDFDVTALRFRANKCDKTLHVPENQFLGFDVRDPMIWNVPAFAGMCCYTYARIFDSNLYAKLIINDGIVTTEIDTKDITPQDILNIGVIWCTVGDKYNVFYFKNRVLMASL
jgi:hypothetical protein